MRPYALLLFMSIAAACAASAPTGTFASGAATPIPWTTTSPRITPIPTPTMPPRPLVRSCTIGELRAIEGHGQGATGTWVRPLLIGTTSSDPCVVDGPIGVTFRRTDGTEVIAAKMASPSPFEPGWALLSPQSAPAVGDGIAKPGQGIVMVWSYGDCGDSRYAAIDVVFTAGTTRIDSAGRVNGRCDAPSQTLGASADAIRAVALSDPSPTPQRLRAAIQGPTTARAGDALHYVVRLTNISSEPYSLRDCPSYIEWLGGREVAVTPPPLGGKYLQDQRRFAGVAKERYLLDCAVPQIDAGITIEFAMELSVPRDALGPDTLRWELLGTGAVASLPITFTSP